MQPLSSILDGAPRARKSGVPKWRANARHWREVDWAVPLDRNERARLLHRAEALEARTRQPGRQNGSVSRIGLIVLRALVLGFLSRQGRCFPSYDAIMKATGLCRQSVANALKRLEQAGLIRIMRRLEVRNISRECPHTGRWQSFLQTVQTSNAYAFDRPVGGAEMLAPPATGRRFPDPAPGGLLRALGLDFAGQHPSPQDRQKHTTK